MKQPVTRLDYCQYLLVSQINYTLTNFADHCEQFSHDAINRYLRGERITPRLIWENVRGQVVPTPKSPAWNAASAAKRVRNGITLAVLSSSGSGSRNSRRKRVVLFINLNTAYWMITLFSSSRNHLSRWLLRKS
jgi:hypothetical protein